MQSIAIKTLGIVAALLCAFAHSEQPSSPYNPQRTHSGQRPYGSYLDDDAAFCPKPESRQTQQLIHEMAEIVISPAHRGDFANVVSNVLMASVMDGNAKPVVDALMSVMEKSEYYGWDNAPSDGNQALLLLSTAITQLKPEFQIPALQKLEAKIWKGINTFGNGKLQEAAQKRFSLLTDIQNLQSYLEDQKGKLIDTEVSRLREVLQKRTRQLQIADGELQEIIQFAQSQQDSPAYQDWLQSFQALYPLALKGLVKPEFLKVISGIPIPEAAQVVSAMVDSAPEDRKEKLKGYASYFIQNAAHAGYERGRDRIYGFLQKYVDKGVLGEFEKMVSPLFEKPNIDSETLSLANHFRTYAQDPRVREAAQGLVGRLAARYKLDKSKVLAAFEAPEEAAYEEAAAARKELAKLLFKAGLEIGKLFDPTGVCNLVHGCVQICEGNYWDASLSFLAMMPMLGKTVNVIKVTNTTRQVFQVAGKLAPIIRQASKFQGLLTKISRVHQELEKIDTILGSGIDMAETWAKEDKGFLEQLLEPQKAAQLLKLVAPRYTSANSRPIRNLNRVLGVAGKLSAKQDRCEVDLTKKRPACDEKQPAWLRALITIAKGIRRPIRRLVEVPNLMSNNSIEQENAERIVFAKPFQDPKEDDYEIASETANDVIRGLKLTKDQVKRFQELVNLRMKELKKLEDVANSPYPTRMEILRLGLSALVS